MFRFYHPEVSSDDAFLPLETAISDLSSGISVPGFFIKINSVLLVSNLYYFFWCRFRFLQLTVEWQHHLSSDTLHYWGLWFRSFLGPCALMSYVMMLWEEIVGKAVLHCGHCFIHCVLQESMMWSASAYRSSCINSSFILPRFLYIYLYMSIYIYICLSIFVFTMSLALFDLLSCGLKLRLFPTQEQ